MENYSSLQIKSLTLEKNINGQFVTPDQLDLSGSVSADSFAFNKKSLKMSSGFWRPIHMVIL